MTKVVKGPWGEINIPKEIEDEHKASLAAKGKVPVNEKTKAGEAFAEMLSELLGEPVTYEPFDEEDNEQT